MPVFFRAYMFIFIGLILLNKTFLTAELSCPPYVPEHIYEQLKPYFLQEEHPLRKKLDKLFASCDVLKNDETLEKAGFKTTGARGYSKVIILKHKKIKNYLIKAYTDEHYEIIDWEKWMKRIQGAIVINSIIEKYGFQQSFKVPKKWIYQVPRGENVEKHFVLVVEDMDIFDQRGNAIRWKGTEYVTKEKLNALCIIMNEAGLKDSVYLNNIPFCLDNKVAFVDTEHFHCWPVPLHKLTWVFASRLQIYWSNLIQNHP